MNDIKAFIAIDKRFLFSMTHTVSPRNYMTIDFDLSEIELSSEVFRSAVTRVIEMLLNHDYVYVNMIGEAFASKCETAEYDVEVFYALSVVVIELNNLERL